MRDLIDFFAIFNLQARSSNILSIQKNWYVCDQKDLRYIVLAIKIYTFILGEGLIEVTATSESIGTTFLTGIRKYFPLNFWAVFHLSQTASDGFDQN